MSVQPAAAYRDDAQETHDDPSRVLGSADRQWVQKRLEARFGIDHLSDSAQTRIMGSVRSAERAGATKQELSAAFADAVQREVVAELPREATRFNLRRLNAEVCSETVIREGMTPSWLDEDRPAWSSSGVDELEEADGSVSRAGAEWRSEPVVLPASTYPCRSTFPSGDRRLSTFMVALRQRTLWRDPQVTIQSPGGEMLNRTPREASLMARALLLHADLAVEGGATA